MPKIADPGNPYKSYIDEFASLRTAVLDRMAASPGIHFHLRIQVFLLLIMAWSFCCLPPGGSRFDRERSGPATSRADWLGGRPRRRVGLALIAALGLPLPETPAWLSRLGRAVPAILLIAGAVRRRRCWPHVRLRRP